MWRHEHSAAGGGEGRSWATGEGERVDTVDTLALQFRTRTGPRCASKQDPNPDKGAAPGRISHEQSYGRASVFPTRALGSALNLFLPLSALRAPCARSSPYRYSYPSRQPAMSELKKACSHASTSPCEARSFVLSCRPLHCGRDLIDHLPLLVPARIWGQCFSTHDSLFMFSFGLAPRA